MSILDRLSRLIRANINDLISRAEDPEKIIGQALEDMKNAWRQARGEVAGAIAELKKLERERDSYAEQASAWKDKAQEALRMNREDLAREALRRKGQADDLARGFGEQIESQGRMVERLKTQLRALEAKIQEAESKKQLLVARQRGVEAAEAVRRMEATSLDASPAVGAFQDMEARIQAMEDKHKALAEIDQNEVDKELEALEKSKNVDEELNNLKHEIGL